MLAVFTQFWSYFVSAFLAGHVINLAMDGMSFGGGI